MVFRSSMSIEAEIESKTGRIDDKVSKDGKQDLLYETLEQLSDVNEYEYQQQKTEVARVKSLEGRGRRLLRNGTQLPLDSEFYAALKHIREKGNVRWKDVAMYLFEQSGLREDQFQKVVEDSRGPTPSSLVYGTIGDNNYRLAQQLELFTPNQQADMKDNMIKNSSQKL